MGPALVRSIMMLMQTNPGKWSHPVLGFLRSSYVDPMLNSLTGPLIHIYPYIKHSQGCFQFKKFWTGKLGRLGGGAGGSPAIWEHFCEPDLLQTGSSSIAPDAARLCLKTNLRTAFSPHLLLARAALSISCLCLCRCISRLLVSCKVWDLGGVSLSCNCGCVWCCGWLRVDRLPLAAGRIFCTGCCTCSTHSASILRTSLCLHILAAHVRSQ